MNQFDDNYYQERLDRSKSQQPFHNNSFLTDDNTDEKNVSHFFSNNNNNEINTKKRIVLNEKDMVILTPVRRIEDINKINRQHQHICNRCYHRLNKKISNDHIFQDVKLFGFILQLLIALFIITLLFISMYLTFVNTSIINNGYKIMLKKCHITLLVSNLLIINFISLILSVFDLNQSKKIGSYRLSNKLLMFVEWSGGWMIKWIFMILVCLNINANSIYLRERFNFLKLSIITLFSIVGPFSYLIFNFNLDENK